MQTTPLSCRLAQWPYVIIQMAPQFVGQLCKIHIPKLHKMLILPLFTVNKNCVWVNRDRSWDRGWYIFTDDTTHNEISSVIYQNIAFPWISYGNRILCRPRWNGEGILTVYMMVMWANMCSMRFISIQNPNRQCPRGFAAQWIASEEKKFKGCGFKSRHSKTVLSFPRGFPALMWAVRCSGEASIRVDKRLIILFLGWAKLKGSKHAACGVFNAWLTSLKSQQSNIWVDTVVRWFFLCFISGLLRPIGFK